MRQIVKGSTSQSLYLVALDSTSTSGGRKTGLVFNSSGLTAYYARNGATSTAITLVTLASASAAWSSGGFVEVDATNMPGVYRLDVPDAAFAAGVDSVVVTIKGATGMVQADIEVQLTASASGTPNSSLGITDQGTAQSIAAANIQLQAGAPASDLTGQTVVVNTASTGAGQCRVITAYNTTTKTATVDAWSPALTGTVTYTVFATAPFSASSPITANVVQVAGTTQTARDLGANLDVAVSSRMASAALPTNFGALAITAGGAVTVGTNNDKTGYTLTSGPLDAPGVRTALGLASANLDTQLAGVNTNVLSRAAPGASMALTTAERVAVADALLTRNISGGSSTGRLVKEALAVLRNKISVTGGTLSVCDVDDTTVLFTAAVTTTAGNPISTIDPA